MVESFEFRQGIQVIKNQKGDWFLIEKKAGGDTLLLKISKIRRGSESYADKIRRFSGTETGI